MTAIGTYFDDLASRLARLQSDQTAAIAEVAELGARAIREQRPIYLYDTGHLVSHELIDRTGGLAAFTALEFSASVSRENEWVAHSRPSPDPTGEESARALVDWLFLQGTLLPGDLLIVGSVSGTNVLVVELARQARERGVVVVAITGVEFSARLAPAHSSGTRLYENADVVLDNEVPYGDASITLAGTSQAVAPWSGVSAVVMMWAVTAAIVERCAETGTPVTIYSSYNLPGGGAQFAASRERYRSTGQ